MPDYKNLTQQYLNAIAMLLSFFGGKVEIPDYFFHKVKLKNKVIVIERDTRRKVTIISLEDDI